MQPFRAGLQIRLQPMLRVLLLALILALLSSLNVPRARRDQGAVSRVNAAPAAAVAAVPPADSNFQKVILDQNVNDSLVEPLDLEVLPDSRAIYVTRRGVVKVWRPATNTAVVAATLTISTQFEDGLSGVVQDPNFAANRYVYLYYIRADVTAARVARFTMSGDTLSLSSEAVIIEWIVLLEHAFIRQRHDDLH